jgi:hypothetical protein
MKQLAAVVALAGCGFHAGSPQGSADANVPDGPGHDAALPDAPSSALNVVETEEPGADWACTDNNSCTADYLAFPGKVPAAYHHPITQAQLQSQLTALLLGQVPLATGPLTADQLAQTIRDDANFGFLQDGIDARKLEVATTARSQTADYEERDLLFRDPFVGTFKAVLLVPKNAGPGPYPAVLAVHGHGDTAEIYRDNYHGHEWPAQGYAILMLTMRAMNIDTSENTVWHALITEGLSLIGIRVYESLLGFKYLRYLSEIDHARIGLIGHSGGSSTGNLTVRIEPRLRAFVSDNQVNWFVSGLEMYHCETLPALYPYNQLIDDFTDLRDPRAEGAIRVHDRDDADLHVLRSAREELTRYFATGLKSKPSGMYTNIRHSAPGSHRLSCGSSATWCQRSPAISALPASLPAG